MPGTDRVEVPGPEPVAARAIIPSPIHPDQRSGAAAEAASVKDYFAAANLGDQMPDLGRDTPDDFSSSLPKSRPLS
jgi:hypothetical protein